NAWKLIKLNPAWNMKIDTDDLTLTPSYAINLPLACRCQLFWRSNFWTIISTLVTVGFSSVFALYYRHTKRVELEERELTDDLIEKSIELLQSPDEPQSMPVLHIRDSLLSPSERKDSKYKRVW